MHTDDVQILYRPYTSEADLPDIMALVQSELSEPYVIFTYRYFLNSWSHLAYIAHTNKSPKPIGVIVSKQEIHKSGTNRGYIAMLSVSKQWRKRGIASQLVRLTIHAMQLNGGEEVTLETEYDNIPALSLYASLGFVREKRLYRFYMSGKDAFRLVLPLAPVPGARPLPQPVVPPEIDYEDFDSDDEYSDSQREEGGHLGGGAGDFVMPGALPMAGI
ncbi:N-alpha-acetyltransferase mak3 [Tulasnella sp. 403]|nr:N-alpha-acetyltransferase mak3 [Tulasnella sp. 403]